MKPTERQIKAIEAVESLCAIWKSSNDISSPSHYTLIDEEMQSLECDLKLDENDEQITTLRYSLYDVFQAIQMII
jgi:hypothetical protein